MKLCAPNVRGACCKTVGCIYSIRQFYDKRTGLEVEKIKELLK